ncbi:LuxR C-terminal-related transcriptional regulator [Stackebrandtia soli]|uniref:LuxR C-terminal-related transcriptional regulator n=1 Tax=Stackebrandtia soli TaxID=1892856 RepID=UPI0039EA984D
MPFAADTRRALLEHLVEAWRDVAKRDEPQRIVIVTGLPAAGKSRLVADAITDFTPAPTVTLIGHGRPAAPGPYDWTATALDGHELAPSRPAEDRDSTEPPLGDAIAWLTRRTTPQSRRIEPTALRRAAIGIVRHLTGDGSAVLVADNAHALDPASLELLATLAAAPDLSALLVVVARTPDAAGPPRNADRALRDLAAARHATTIALPDPRPRLTEVDPLVNWARYTHATNDAARHAATLDAAAALIRDGRATDALDLIEECLTTTPGSLPSDSETSARLALARALMALGHPGEAGRVAADIDPRREPGAAALVDTLRTIDELTSREREVLNCVAAGMTNQQTATALGISIRTVTVHVSNLLRKTGTTSRTEAALWAVQHGLTRREPPPPRR